MKTMMKTHKRDADRKNTQGRKPQTAAAGTGATKVDPALLDRAVKEINAIHRGKCETIGQYILDTFFGGDLEAYRNDPDNLTFQMLRKRDDLEVAYSTLCMILNTMLQKPQLAAAAKKLDFSHQTRLLSVKNPERKLELAKRAADNGWSVKRLDQAIAKERPKARQETLRVKAYLTRLDETVSHLTDKGVVIQIRSLDTSERQPLLKQVRKGITRLERLCKTLDKA